jgi:HSP20 family molecular chaperone IbpA
MNARHHEHTVQDGSVHVREVEFGKAFRSVHLPARIDPHSVKAEYRNGMLHLTAAIANGAAPGVTQVDDRLTIVP